MATSKKKKKKDGMNANVIFVIAIIVVIVILASLAIKQPKEPTTDDYNSFPFAQDASGFWYVNLEFDGVPTSILFRYHPKELEDIIVQEGSADPLKKLSARIKNGEDAQLYITMDPDAPGTLAMAGVEIAKITGERNGLYNIPTNAALSKRTNGTSADTLIVDCGKASEDTVVIWIKTDGDNLIAQPLPNCVVLQGTEANDTIRVADRYMYELFGIMGKN